MVALHTVLRLIRSRQDVDVDRCLLQFCVSHLRGQRALPHQFVEAALLLGALDGLVAHIGRSDGLVGLLRTLGVGVELSGLAIVLAIDPHDLFLARVDGQRGEVDAVRTHVGDVTRLVETLGHHHGLRDREAEFAGRLLLEGGGGERRGRGALHGMLGYGRDAEACSSASLQEGLGLLVGGETMIEFRFHLYRLAFGIGQREEGIDAIERFALESLHLALALHDESECDALYATCGERWFHLAPEHRRKSEAHQTVEHAASLLRVDKVHVQMAWRLDGVDDGRFGNLVKHDTVGLLLVQSQHLAQVPRDGFSLAVFIGCEPHHLRVAGAASKFCYQRFLLLRYLIARLKCVQVDTQFFLFQIANMTIGRHHLEVFA